ncbi:MAG: 16S rRNA (adenine(1518)-N(6)/adenine(1519)-N(6))-dimethyltransferase RsmA [Chlamydiales bacterium]|nr:16S rRNA (adenine(1518)-N(6)/adenine(1519)-N(6))-dimethyltransferase RsmA [Chlamydiales bacterium]
MTIAQLSQLLPFLESLGVRPKKTLSQNFLIDPNIVRKIVELSHIEPGDYVLEIGSGPGALTEELLKRGAYVTAIEKDTSFARELDRFQNGNLTVIEEDILAFDWTMLEDRPWKIIGNLPYHITTPIIETVCQNKAVSFTFMLQKELAERIIAPPGSKECGCISVFVHSHALVSGSFHVSNTCFYPKPNVDSTVLSLQFHKEKDPESLFTFVRTAFQQRRKMITSSLRRLFPQERIKEALLFAKAPITARPETLTLGQWRTLFQILST